MLGAVTRTLGEKQRRRLKTEEVISGPERRPLASLTCGWLSQRAAGRAPAVPA